MSRPRWAVASALLIGLAGVVFGALGLAALGGADRIESYVAEIESNADFGSLYLSLGVWGVIALAVGAAELAASISLWRDPVRARLGALIVAYFGLPLAFFTLAIFRLGSVAAALLLLGAIWVLSYRSGLPRS